MPSSVVRIVGMNGGGGCRLHCYQVNQILEAKGIETTTFIPAPSFDDDITSASLVPFRYFNTLSFVAISRYIWKGRRTIQYVHIHLKNAVILYSIVPLVLGVPLYITVHQAIEMRSLRQALSNCIYGFFLRRASKVIAISRFIGAQVSAFNVVSTRIYNGSDGGRAASGANDSYPLAEMNGRPLRVGIVGELTRRKGIHELPELAKICEGVEFHVFGTGPLESVLKNSNNIKLRGYVADQDEIYSTLDVVLALSYDEPFGRTLTEGFARRRVVIGRESGAFPEILPKHSLFQSISDIPKILRRLREQDVWTEVINEQSLLFQEKFSISAFERSIKEHLT